MLADIPRVNRAHRIFYGLSSLLQLGPLKFSLSLRIYRNTALYVVSGISEKHPVLHVLPACVSGLQPYCLCTLYHFWSDLL